MIRRQQKLKHDPDNGVYGDCFRTCVAIILEDDPEDIPHFCDPTQFKNHKRALQQFLNGIDLGTFTVCFPGDVSFEDVLFTTGHYNPDIPVIVSGKSPRGVTHCVVVMDGEVFCDPHDGTDNPDPFLGPCEETGMWWIEVIAMKGRH